jgi:hypothetical protein
MYFGVDYHRAMGLSLWRAAPMTREAAWKQDIRIDGRSGHQCGSHGRIHVVSANLRRANTTLAGCAG